MKKLALFVAAIAAIPALLGASVFADSPGQLSNGASNYKVRNVTKNGEYSQTIAATCGETVKYSITLSNSDYGLLKDLTVKANIASGAISASAINASNETTSVSGNAKVNLDKGTLAYVPGSTVRITSDGKTSTPQADGITAGGVNVGNLNGSTAIFVQFQAKVECPTTPPVTPPVTPPTPPETPKTPKTPVVTPAELPATGAADVIAKLAGVVALTGASVYYVASRRS
jgi:hypothetical protein